MNFFSFFNYLNREVFTQDASYLPDTYFLTTGYNPDFGDEQHKIMLDQLRDSDFKWLFSMQYREFHTNKASKGNSKRTSAQKAGQPLIKCYRDYFAGFVNEFTVQYEGKKPYYTSNPDVLSSLADDYFVILFRNSKDTAEMMICNFDVRRVIPYGGETVVIPFREFMKLPFDGKEHKSYGQIAKLAEEYRENDIVNNYASGAWV